MSAVLTRVPGQQGREDEVPRRCAQDGHRGAPPDVNLSRVRIRARPDPRPDDVRFGLAGIRNVGEAVVEQIIRARQEGGDVQGLLRLLLARRRERAQQADDRVDDQGRCVRLDEPRTRRFARGVRIGRRADRVCAPEGERGLRLALRRPGRRPSDRTLVGSQLRVPPPSFRRPCAWPTRRRCSATT